MAISGRTSTVISTAATLFVIGALALWFLIVPMRMESALAGDNDVPAPALGQCQST